MGDKIVLNIMGFDAANRGVNNVVSDLEIVKSNLEKCNAVLSEKWKGKSSEKFFNTYNEVNKNFEVYIEELNHLANTLKDVERTFIEKDNELDNFIKKSEVNYENIS